MATPLVSGIVGLLKSVDPKLTGAQARALLQATGAKVNIETACNCRVDAAAAVEALQKKKMLVVPMAAALDLNETVQLDVMNAKGAVSFASSDDAILSVSETGLVTAKAKGEARISAKDSEGNSLETLDFIVGQSSGNDGGGGGPTPPGECPLGDPQLCEIICGIQPDLPFCQ